MKGIKYYNSMNEFITERSMHIVKDPEDDLSIDNDGKKTASGKEYDEYAGVPRAIMVHNKTYKTFKT